MLLQSILAILCLNICIKLWVLKEVKQRALAKHYLDGFLSNLLNFNSPCVRNIHKLGKETHFFFFFILQSARGLTIRGLRYRPNLSVLLTSVWFSRSYLQTSIYSIYLIPSSSPNSRSVWYVQQLSFANVMSFWWFVGMQPGKLVVFTSTLTEDICSHTKEVCRMALVEGR